MNLLPTGPATMGSCNNNRHKTGHHHVPRQWHTISKLLVPHPMLESSGHEIDMSNSHTKPKKTQMKLVRTYQTYQQCVCHGESGRQNQPLRHQQHPHNHGGWHSHRARSTSGTTPHDITCNDSLPGTRTTSQHAIPAIRNCDPASPSTLQPVPKCTTVSTRHLSWTPAANHTARHGSELIHHLGGGIHTGQVGRHHNKPTCKQLTARCIPSATNRLPFVPPLPQWTHSKVPDDLLAPLLQSTACSGCDLVQDFSGSIHTG
jgi:hypothetical protein